MTDTHSLALLRNQFSSQHWPRIDNINAGNNQFTIDLYISNDMYWLQGHFPQQPVVAGVVQTHWAGELAKQLFNTGDAFVRIDNLKFQQVILPEQELQLTLEHSQASGSSAIKFRYSKGDTLFSEGKLVFTQTSASLQPQ